MKTQAKMLMVDENGQGQMIVDGKTYAVRSEWTQQSFTVGDRAGYSSRWSIHVTSVKCLDEEAQARRIDGLERELAREREILADIRTALIGEEEQS